MLSLSSVKEIQHNYKNENIKINKNTNYKVSDTVSDNLSF